MIKFGPSGISQDYASRVKSTMDIPDLLVEDELDCFEYSFGRGVSMSRPTAEKICHAFKARNKEISAHAPYFINFATQDEEKLEKTFGYLSDTVTALRLMGGKRVVFHAGSPMKSDRQEAFQRLKSNFMKYLDFAPSPDILVCPETMGKVNQIGTLEEVIELCLLAENVYPCIDFGHLNAREGGSLKDYASYKSVIDELMNRLGTEKTKNMHIHFSKIEFTAMGEKRHLTFADEIYGPPFEPLLEVIKDYKLTPYLVTESAGTQSEDVKLMKKYYNGLQ